MKAENVALAKQLSALVPEGIKADDIAAVIAEAATFNPDDPPQFLRRAIATLKALGVQTTPEMAPAIAEAAKKSAASGSGAGGEHSWPPIITLSEADGQFFPSGSAELPTGLQEKLKGPVIERLLAAIKEFKVDVIEVIGHTDEQPIVARTTTLDRSLLPYLRSLPSERIIPADNAGLGLARAVSVVRMLSADPRLKPFSVLPLSGGQLINIGDRVSDGTQPVPADARRRIEIRLRRSSSDVQVVNNDWSGTVSVSEPPPVLPLKIEGTASVVDGDTIEVANTKN